MDVSRYLSFQLTPKCGSLFQLSIRGIFFSPPKFSFVYLIFASPSYIVSFLLLNTSFSHQFSGSVLQAFFSLHFISQSTDLAVSNNHLFKNLSTHFSLETMEGSVCVCCIRIYLGAITIFVQVFSLSSTAISLDIYSDYLLVFCSFR